MSEDNEEGGGGILDVAGNKVKIVLAICTAAVTLVVGVVKLHKELKGEKPEPKPANAIIVVNGSTAGSNGVVVVTVPAPQHDSATEAHDTTPANPGVNTIGVPQREGSGDARAAMNPAIGDSGKPSELEGKIIAATTSVARPEFGAGPPGNSASASPPLREPRLVRNEISIPRFESTEEVEYLESQGYGRASDRETAVFKALEEAVSKHGATLSADVKLKLEAETKRFNETKTRRVEQSVSSNCALATDGLLKWWDIKSETEETGTYTVEVVAVVAKIKASAGTHATRKTLAVLPFRVSEDVRLKDRTVPAGTIGVQLRESAVTYLVQSRKFAVVDKTFDEELTRLSEATPSSDPIQRAIDAGRKLGAQYLVTGAAEGLQVSQKNIGGLSPASAEGVVSLRIIEVQTRQTVLAKAFMLSEMPDLDLGGDRADVSIADALGRAMAERTLETIYPLKVAALNGPDEVVLNRGGDVLSAGDKVDLFNPGEEVKDPSTGETLGVAERKVATAEVIRVLPKVSYAKVINKTEDVMVEAICRKPQQSKTGTKNTPPAIRNEIDKLFK